MCEQHEFRAGTSDEGINLCIDTIWLRISYAHLKDSSTEQNMSCGKLLALTDIKFYNFSASSSGIH